MHNNQIIFLDIDGVLNSTVDSIRKYESGKSTLDMISESCVESFEKLLDKLPDVKIVISSTWRYRFKNGPFKPDIFRGVTWCDYLGEKIAERIIDHTDRTLDDDIRGDDIHKWLQSNPHGDWAIIDDDSDMLVYQMCRFIKIDRKYGFDEEHIDYVIKLLKGNQNDSS